MLEALLQSAAGAKLAALGLTEHERNDILLAVAAGILQDSAAILAANAKDVAKARGTITEVMLDRLTLDAERIEAMAKGVQAVAALPCAVGRIESTYTHANGMVIEKKRVPMGVVAIIYESRPNVTLDAAALCIKSGNVCILRGGKEALATNMAIAHSIRSTLAQGGYAQAMVSYVEYTSHDSANELMRARGYVDLLIPRGGAGLIRACVDNATVPCIETGTGINHVYVDKSAATDMAVQILVNAKASRPSVCNAAEVCLVHSAIADGFLPILAQAMAKCGVQLRLCERAIKIIAGEKANEHDFDTEFLDYILSVKIVDSLDEAIEHIARHSTHHSEAIITSDTDAASRFCNEVDSAAVYVNASTRFTDGGEFGFGCEMGISTQKLGARGPMGLSELTSYKYCIKGTGQIR